MIGLRNFYVSIDGEKIYLRILEEKDASIEYCEWLNDPVVNKYLETRQATVEDLKKYIREKLVAEDCLFFGIFWKAENKHIGNIKLEPIDLKNKKATLGMIIGDKNYWGRGIAKAATDLAVDYAFNQLGLQEIKLGVISENTAAIRVYEKCGFEAYSVDNQAINHDGRLFDQIWMHKINN